jgi:hypothetical protein
LRDGQLVSVNSQSMQDIISRHVKSLRLVNKRTADKPKFEIEYYSFPFLPGIDPEQGPDERALTDLIAALVRKVAKGPSRPTGLTPQQRREVLARRRVGEPEDRIAAAYGVDPKTVRQIELDG